MVEEELQIRRKQEHRKTTNKLEEMKEMDAGEHTKRVNWPAVIKMKN